MANFNAPPYFDDYDENKNFYKVLFRPSVAIQARELNQLQTMLQKQIERFGSHIFREGSIVVGGSFDVEFDLAYIIASAVAPSTSRLQEFVGKTIIGVTSGITASVKAAVYDETTNKYFFLIRYISSSTTSDVFLNEETVNSYTLDTSGVVVVDSTFNFVVDTTNVTTPRQVGSTFSIGQGVIFSKGYFLAFPAQTIVLSKDSATPTITVGFTITEAYDTDLSDDSLLDNALGTTNENAPGAHRYKITTTLTSIPFKTSGDDENFVLLMDINSGVIEERKERSQYAKIYEEIAKRTHDESGDYYVKGFGIRTREHLDTGINEGLFTNSAGGNAYQLSIDVEPGTAYVKGYEVNKLVTSHVITDKAITYNYVNNQLVNSRNGGFFYIKEIVGSLDHDEAIRVNLFSNTETRITSNIKSSTANTSNNIKVGDALLKALVYESGTLGTNTAQMRAYLYDFNMSNGYVISDVKSIYSSTSPNYFFADVVANTTINDTNESVLIFPIGTESVRSIRGNTGSSDTTYQINRSVDADINFASGNGRFTVAPISVLGESLSYSEGGLSSSEKRELILSLNADKDIQLPGVITAASATSNLITGSFTGANSGFNFTKLKAGDRLLRSGGAEYTILTITNSTSLSLTSNAGTTFTSNLFSRALRTGDIIDLTSNGSSGTAIAANVVAGSLIIDIKEDTTNVAGAGNTVNAKLTFRVDRNTSTAGAEIRKYLRSNRFVKIQTNTNINVSGPYNLGLPDVYKIRSVRMHNSAFSTGTEGSNVTSSFTLDNGQRDNYYDHGKLNVTGNLTLTDKFLLVELDHFEADYSTGLGYFSVDSYPVDDTVASNTSIFTYEIPKYVSTFGVSYNLRNSLDFRAYKTSTAISSVNISSATSNPATSTTFNVDSNGLRMVAPDSDISLDYSFYLPRTDIITLNKDGVYNIIKGQPSKSPISPNVPDNVMGVATIYLSPYPSVSETLARIINVKDDTCSTKKMAQIRYTMREIGVLKNRIENLEYYNALTLLEKSAVDFKITDSSGLDRFKNGFFVDAFSDHSLGDSGNLDYKIAIDKEEGCIRPFFDMESFQYKLETSGSSGYQNSGGLITRPYSEVILLENKNATTVRNIEQGVFRFIGIIEIDPESDTWCDITTVDKVIAFGEELPTESVMQSAWGSWETHAVGYNVYDRRVGDRSGKPKPKLFLGKFTSYAAALARSKNTPLINKNGKRVKGERDDRSVIETVTSQERTATVTTVSYENQIEELGNFVTDVSVLPYIRAQTLTVIVKGLKANTKFYLFFDGENMSEYLTPITIITNEDGTFDVGADEEGDIWRSNEYGEATAYLRIPEDSGKKFRIGTKEITVTDSPTNAIDCTSYAKKYWTASGIAVNKQNTILSTKVPVITQETITEERKKVKTEVMGPSCMAYSFKVDAPVDVDGVFLTSVDVWVEQKHPTLGAWFEIREMNSAGGITRNQIPNSEVWLTTSEFNLWEGSPSDEQSKYTKITFPAPVFLLNDTQYAFVIHTEGLNPDYYFWVSRLGEEDVITGNQVTGRQLTGTLFTTNNNLNYDMVPDVDLKIRFNRASFTLGSGTIILGNRPTEFLNLSTISGSFSRAGENIITSDALTLDKVTNSTSGSISVGSKINSTNSSGGAISGNVISISNSVYYTDAFGFLKNASYSVANSTNVSITISGNVQSVIVGTGQLRKYNSVNNFMIIDNSNGKFFTNAVIKGVLSSNTARIGNSSSNGFDQYKYSTTTLKPYYLNFNDTTTSFEKVGWRSEVSANNFDFYEGSSIFFPGTSDSYSTFNNEVTILSSVNELSKFGTSSPNSSARVRIVIDTNSEFVSPVIDLTKAQSIFVHNIINNDNTGEANTSGGNLLNRYISKSVTLADGQDAEDLLIKLSAYSPPQSNVEVYMKIRNNEDGNLLYENNWIKMDSSFETVSSSEANINDYFEIDYTVPNTYKNGNGVLQYIKNSSNITANTTGINAAANSILLAGASTIFAANDEVFYSVPPGGTPITPLSSNTYYFIHTVNSTAFILSTTAGGSQIDITDFRTDSTAQIHTIGGEVYTGFKQFSIKIGLLGTNSANPPKVADFRAIALQL